MTDLYSMIQLRVVAYHGVSLKPLVDIGMGEYVYILTYPNLAARNF